MNRFLAGFSLFYKCPALTNFFSVSYVIFLNILLLPSHEVIAVAGVHTPAVTTTRVLIQLLQPQRRPCRNEPCSGAPGLSQILCSQSLLPSRQLLGGEDGLRLHSVSQYHTVASHSESKKSSWQDLILMAPTGI